MQKILSWFKERHKKMYLTRLDYYYVAAILSNLFFYISIWTILFHFLFWLIYGTVIDSGNGLVCIFMFKSSLLLNAKISFCHFLWLFLPFKVVLTIFFSVVKFIHNFYFLRIALPWVWGLYWVFCLAGLGLGLGWVALHRITIIISLHFLCWPI